MRFAQRGRDAKLLDGRVDRADARRPGDRRRAHARSAWRASWAARIPASATAPRTCCSKARSSARSIVAGRGRRYGLITDASQRFERGVDPELQERAIERATQLLLECAGGTAGPARSYAHGRALSGARARFACVISASQHVLGAPARPPTSVADCLTRLGMKVEGVGAGWSRHAAELALRHQHRRRPDRGGRAHVRLRQHSRAERDRARSACSRGRKRACATSALRICSSIAAIRKRSLTRSWIRRCRRCCSRTPALALANPISAELGGDARVAVAGLVAGARQQSAASAAARAPVRGRPSLRGTDGAETEVIAGCRRGLGAAGAVGRRSDEGRFLRREGRCRSAARAHRRSRAIPLRAGASSGACIPGQSARIWRGDRAVGWLGALHPEHSRAAGFDISGVRVRARDARRACVVMCRFSPRFPDTRPSAAILR